MSTSQVTMDAEQRIRELQKQLDQQKRLHQANIKTLCADLETAYDEIDKKKERLAKLEEVVDVQGETIKSAHKNLTAEQKKKEIFTRELKEKYEELEKLDDLCKCSTQKLERTEERLLVAREEISYLRALSKLDTSFDEQSSSASSTINTVAALAEKAAHSDEGAAFITTVKPKDLPECWGVRFPEINLPGYSINLQAIKEELKQKGKTNRRGVFKLRGGERKQLRCTLVPKY